MSPKPNILHIFVDQQRWDTIAALGNPVIKTPNLDRLCDEGLVFSNAFSPSPVCVSARCSMIHGQYPHNTGYYGNCCGKEIHVEERDTFMTGLSRAGYRTHGIGKCHFQPVSEALRGFETREMEEGGCNDPEKDGYMDFLIKTGKYQHVGNPYGVGNEMYYIPQVAPVAPEHHFTQWVGNRSTAFMEDQANSDRPWYLYSGFIHPHPPFTPPDPWHRLYRSHDMPEPFVPDNWEDLLIYINKVQNRYKERDQGIDLNLMLCMKAYYYACISFIDFQVGRMLDCLGKTGQADNTIVLFSSDHGEMMGDLNCLGKRSMHNGASRIPMLLKYPGVLEGGMVCDKAANLVDLAPTFLNAGGGSLETHEFDGVDLVDLAQGNCNRDIVFSQQAATYEVNMQRASDCVIKYPPERRLEEISAMSDYMAVSKDWKYVYSAPDQQEFLFDRNQDPMEINDLASNPEYVEQLKNLRSSLINKLYADGETAGLEEDKWRQFPKIDVDPDPQVGLINQGARTPWSSDVIPGYSG